MDSKECSGPASKTLGKNQARKRKRGGNQEPPVATRTPTETGAGQTSSSLSTSLVCVKRSASLENMSLPSPPSRAMTMSPTSLKSTCLFCSDPVIITGNEDAKSKSAKERNEIVKTLCFHLQMEPTEVPKNCTAEMFPFCGQCQRIVTQLWENEKIIQEAQKKISKNLASIERTVADAELLRTTINMSGPSAATATGEEKKFTKLRDTILDGYRNKLLMKQKLRENLILGNDMKVKQAACSHTAVMQDKALSRQFTASRPRVSPSGTSQDNQVQENITVNVNPLDVGMNSSASSPPDADDNMEEQAETPTPEPDRIANDTTLALLPNIQSPPAPQHQQQQRDYQRQQGQQSQSQRPVRKSTNAGASWMGPGGVVGNYNEASCTMVISDVRSDSEQSTPVVIKQEPGETLAPVAVQPGKRKRRTLFQGIEIFRVTDLRNNRTHMQCSICRLTVLVTSYSTGTSPYQAMTQHITEKHLGKRRRAALNVAANQATDSAKKRQFTCKICSKVFQNKKALFDHRATHAPSESPPQSKPNVSTTTSTTPSKASQSYYIENLECDVCGRPIKGNTSNLLAHKFSHKNNEERQASIAAGERGSRNALLRGPEAYKRRPVAKFQTKKVRKGKSKVFFGSTGRRVPVPQDESGSASKPIKCQVCFRSFTRNCHLVLHMQGHARRSQLPMLPALSPKKPKTFTSVRRQKLQEQQEQQQLRNMEEQSRAPEEDSFQEGESLENNVPNLDQYAPNSDSFSTDEDDAMNYLQDQSNADADAFDMSGAADELMV